MHLIDGIIIACYLILIVAVGYYVSRLARKSINSYFLGGKSIPWYILSMSNATSMFDLAGIMWGVSIVLIYGMKCQFIFWLWASFNQIFHMVYMSGWIRRSNVLTGAEWMTTRFGKGQGGEMARLGIVVFSLVSVMAFIGYAFKGIGKFAMVMLPWDLTPDTYAFIIIGFTTIYVIVGGMYSVVLTDIIQFAILNISAVTLVFIIYSNISLADLAAVVPDGWSSIFFGKFLNHDWSNLIPSVNDKIKADGYSMFSIFFVLVFFKNVVQSASGSAQGYELQRILAAKNPREAALMSGFVNVLRFAAYAVAASFAVMALVYYSPQLKAMGPNIDFELILPYVVNNFIPPGLMGLMLAGFLAAYMSTFDSTVNAGAAYLVNDVYKRYINPKASDTKLVKSSYICTAIVVVVGVLFGMKVQSLHSIIEWIVAALWGGYTAPNVLKWYWWRLNGHGYFWGTVVGTAAALILPQFLPGLSMAGMFPLILAISTVACILGSLLTPPTEDSVIKGFYRQVRPWGFWKSVHQKVVKEVPGFKKNTDFKRDMFNVGVSVIWQNALIYVPLYLVIMNKVGFGVSVALVALTTLTLKKTWYDKLERN